MVVGIYQDGYLERLVGVDDFPLPPKRPKDVPLVTNPGPSCLGVLPGLHYYPGFPAKQDGGW